jgi:hypothetical protein
MGTINSTEKSPKSDSTRAETAYAEQRKQDNTKYCQALTRKGNRCSRKALFEGKTRIGKIKIPFLGEKEVDCCYLCSQHLSMYSTLGLYKVLKWYYIDKNMSYEEWCIVYPEECDHIQNKKIL